MKLERTKFALCAAAALLLIALGCASAMAQGDCAQSCTLGAPLSCPCDGSLQYYPPNDYTCTGQGQVSGYEDSACLNYDTSNGCPGAEANVDINSQDPTCPGADGDPCAIDPNAPAPCLPGYSCVDGYCQSNGSPPPNGSGNKCAADGQSCASLPCCNSLACNSADICTSGSPTCTTDNDCSGGLVCQPDGTCGCNGDICNDPSCDPNGNYNCDCLGQCSSGTCSSNADCPGMAGCTGESCGCQDICDDPGCDANYNCDCLGQCGDNGTGSGSGSGSDGNGDGSDCYWDLCWYWCD